LKSPSYGSEVFPPPPPLLGFFPRRFPRMGTPPLPHPTRSDIPLNRPPPDALTRARHPPTENTQATLSLPPRHPWPPGYLSPRPRARTRAPAPSYEPEMERVLYGTRLWRPTSLAAHGADPPHPRRRSPPPAKAPLEPDPLLPFSPRVPPFPRALPQLSARCPDLLPPRSNFRHPPRTPAPPPQPPFPLPSRAPDEIRPPGPRGVPDGGSS